MAVENKYTNPEIVAGKKAADAYVHGAEPYIAVETFEVAAADDDLSVYRVFKNVSGDLIPVDIMVFNDAITGGTDYDLGLYETLVDGQGGAVVNRECLAATLNMSSAAARGSEKDGLNAVNIDSIRKRLFEIAGHTFDTRKQAYDIAFTAVTVGSGAGTISVIAIFVQG